MLHTRNRKVDNKMIAQDVGVRVNTSYEEYNSIDLTKNRI